MSTLTANPVSPSVPVSADPQALIKDALRKVTAIASLPEVTAQIIKTVQDPNSTANQLHKIVSHDPSLVTRILKVVNSAFYGLPGQIGSIERAIVLLGLNAVKNIAVAASLGQLFRGVKLCEGFTARDLWTHCIAVGVVARELAKQIKCPVADEAFLAGMIHDSGMLVQLQVWPDQLREVCERSMAESADSKVTFVALEKEIIGIDHQQLGAALAEHWRFPKTCQLVAARHHAPERLGEDVRTLVSLVYVADTLVAHAAQGFNLTAVRQKLSDDVLDTLALTRPTIEKVEANLNELVSSAASVLG